MDLETLSRLAEQAVRGDVRRSDTLLALEARDAGLWHCPSTAYCDFLYLLTKEMQPRACLEIGTCRGLSAAHLAWLGATVATLDLDPAAAQRVAEINKAHDMDIVAITADSRAPDPKSAAMIRQHAPYDILFIDGDHTLASAYGDYVRFWPLVREGGVILFDDLQLTDEMRAVWARITEPKVPLDALHATGFGAVLRGIVAPKPLPTPTR